MKFETIIHVSAQSNIVCKADFEFLTSDSEKL